LEGVEEIENMVFSDCRSLSNVKIPDSITKIGVSAFSDCTSLERVVLGDLIVSIESHAFIAQIFTE
jgi:hypothetical protein